MVDFTVVSSVVDDANLELLGVSDLEIATIGGQHYLFVASEGDGSVTSFKLTSDLAPILVDTIHYSTSSGTLAVGQLTLTDVEGVLTLLPSARYDDDAATYLINGTGNLSVPVTQPNTGLAVGNLILTHSVIIAGKTFLYAVERGVPGITGYWMQSNESFSTPVAYSDAEFDYFGDVSAFASVTIGTEIYLFTASALDSGLNSFRVDQNGALQIVDSVGPNDASGFSLPQALETAVAYGQTYLLLASAGTNSITVYVVDENGELSEVDHLIDTVETRFEDASVLESFTYEGRTFILAAGSDDGLTLLELSSTGELSITSVLEDSFDATLDNITDIEVVVIDMDIHAFVSSGTENGFTQIQITIGNTGIAITGDETHEYLYGTAVDDTFFGAGGNDRIFGGDGNDIFMDGAGRDHFYGGVGADTFQFFEDGILDLIRDYEHGIDTIDLSLLPGVSGIDDLDIHARSFGAVIYVGGEEIWIMTEDGTGLTSYDFSADDFIF